MCKQAIVFCVVAALGGGGCAHSDTARQVEERAAKSFDEAYEAVRSGARQTASYGGYIIERIGQGGVRVYREAKAGARGAAQSVSDATVTATVKTKLAADPGVHSRDIDVETDAGVVTLRGTVPDPSEASRAIQDTLQTGGVFAVTSELSWPAMRTGQRAPEITPPPPATEPPPSTEPRPAP